MSSKRPCWLRPVLADWLEHRVIRAGSSDIVHDAHKSNKVFKSLREVHMTLYLFDRGGIRCLKMGIS